MCYHAMKNLKLTWDWKNSLSLSVQFLSACKKFKRVKFQIHLSLSKDKNIKHLIVLKLYETYLKLHKFILTFRGSFNERIQICLEKSALKWIFTSQHLSLQLKLIYSFQKVFTWLTYSALKYILICCFQLYILFNIVFTGNMHLISI